MMTVTISTKATPSSFLAPQMFPCKLALKEPGGDQLWDLIWIFCCCCTISSSLETQQAASEMYKNTLLSYINKQAAWKQAPCVRNRLESTGADKNKEAHAKNKSLLGIQSCRMSSENQSQQNLACCKYLPAFPPRRLSRKRFFGAFVTHIKHSNMYFQIRCSIQWSSFVLRCSNTRKMYFLICDLSQF